MSATATAALAPDQAPPVTTVDQAYAYVLAQARAHYENFPVASLLLPRGLGRHVAAVYAFARAADDLADEPGMGDAAERLRRLDRWEDLLRAAAAGQPGDHPVFVALGRTMAERSLPIEPFLDLLTAFRRDVTTSRHPDRAELLDYCRYSANPVGRLVLLLAGIRDGETHRLSDAVCTALQLANFWQDLAVDLARDRIYLPQDAMRRHGLSEAGLRAGLEAGRVDDGLRAAVAEEVAFARTLFAAGYPIVDRVRGRLALELKLTCWGGVRVLERIAAQAYDTLTRRPSLGPRDWAAIGWRVATGRRVA